MGHDTFWTGSIRNDRKWTEKTQQSCAEAIIIAVSNHNSKSCVDDEMISFLFITVNDLHEIVYYLYHFVLQRIQALSGKNLLLFKQAKKRVTKFIKI